MNTQLLRSFGLTKTEIKIYIALLKLGQSTTTNIVRTAGIHASKVYEFLDRLVQKGLVSYVIKSNKKYFTAAEPMYLKEFLAEKKEKLKEQEKQLDFVIPQLQRLRKVEEEKILFEVYEGLRGIKSVYEKVLMTLGKGETQYIIGAPRIGNEQLEGFLLEWHKRRIKKGIHCKYIYDSDVRDYGKKRQNMLYTTVRYLPGNISSPVWIEIFKYYVIIGHIKKFNAVVFLLHDKEIARSYLDYFNLMWNAAEK